MNRSLLKATLLGFFILVGEVTSPAQIQTYCTNISGNIACTSYNNGASSQSYCTSIAGNLSCTTYNDNYNKVQIQQNYEAGQVIGTALGNAVAAAIEQYKANKRIRQAKQEEWNQFVQDTLATNELTCETDPKKQGTTLVGCRTMMFTFNQFLHRHQKDFVIDGKNIEMLANALDKTAPSDQSSWTELTYEAALQTLNKNQLDRKVYIGHGNDRKVW